MAFEKFLNRPSNEYALLKQLAAEVALNFSKYHGHLYYIHLVDSGNQTSLIDEVQDLAKVEDPWHYTYLHREKQAFILLRSNEDSITLHLHGERDGAEFWISLDSVLVVMPHQISSLTGARRSKLTTLQKMEAFGQIGDSLEDLGKKKAS